MDALLWQDKALSLLDQGKYPQEEVWYDCKDFRSVIQVLKSGVVRGDTLPGIAAAYGYALAALEYQGAAEFHDQMAQARAQLMSCMPLSSSIPVAFERLDQAYAAYHDSEELVTALLAAAVTVHRVDVIACRASNREGAGIVPEEAKILLSAHHSVFHSGSYGGALGVVRTAFVKKKVERVYICENRPGLEGATQMAGELLRNHVPTTLLSDQTAASLMGRRACDIVLADGIRMAANGDLIATPGTYGLAISAYFHGVPFYAVLHSSRLDRSLPNGAGFAEHDGDAAQLNPPEGAEAWLPQYDVLPEFLLTGIITDKGLAFPPYAESLEELLLKAPEKSVLVL